MASNGALLPGRRGVTGQRGKWAVRLRPLVLACVCAVSNLAVCRSRLAQPEAEFVRQAREQLPERGSWTATFVAGEPGTFSQAQIGYDVATGHWFLAHQAACVGQDAAGYFQSSSPRLDEPIEYRQPSGAGQDGALDRLAGAPMLKALIRGEHPILSAEALEEGGWRVTTSIPGGGRAVPPEPVRSALFPVTVLLEFDDQMRLVRHEHGGGSSRMIWEFEYSEQERGALAVPLRVVATIGEPPRVSSVVRTAFEMTPAGARSPASSQATARAASVAADRSVRQALAAAGGDPRFSMVDFVTTSGAEGVESGDRSQGTPGDPTAARPGGARGEIVRTRALVLAGIVTLVVGALAWLWRRRGSPAS